MQKLKGQEPNSLEGFCTKPQIHLEGKNDKSKWSKNWLCSSSVSPAKRQASVSAANRVSTTGQNLDSQIDALYDFGCDKVFSDKTSGIKEQREGWNQLMDYIRKDDLLVVTELSRMTRSLKHLLQVVEDLEKLGVAIISLKENIDTSTATGRCFISIIGAIAQMERAFLVKFFSLTSERSEEN